MHFVRNFIRGKIDRTVYAELVVQLYHVYRTLEHCLLQQTSTTNHEQQEQRVLAEQFRDFHKKLERTETLEEDLDYWKGPVRTEEIVGTAWKPIRCYYWRTRTRGTWAIWVEAKYWREWPDAPWAWAKPRKVWPFTNLPTQIQGRVPCRTGCTRIDRRANHQARGRSQCGLFAQYAIVWRTRRHGQRSRRLQAALAYANTANGGNNMTEEEETSAAKCPFIVKDKKKSPTKTDECPFANTSATTSQQNEPRGSAATAKKHHGKCPWPFIILHDPVAS